MLLLLILKPRKSNVKILIAIGVSFGRSSLTVLVDEVLLERTEISAHFIPPLMVGHFSLLTTLQGVLTFDFVGHAGGPRHVFVGLHDVAEVFPAKVVFRSIMFLQYFSVVTINDKKTSRTRTSATHPCCERREEA